MATYVQFKDGVAHAHVTTDGVLEDPSFVQVECSGHEHLGQSWNGSEWVDAKPIRYAILDDHGTIVQINTTLYASEVQGKILEDDAIQVNWEFDGTKFNPPVTELDRIKAAQDAAKAAEDAFWENERAKQAAGAAELSQNPVVAIDGVVSNSETTTTNPPA